MHGSDQRKVCVVMELLTLPYCLVEGWTDGRRMEQHGVKSAKPEMETVEVNGSNAHSNDKWRN